MNNITNFQKKALAIVCGACSIWGLMLPTARAADLVSAQTTFTLTLDQAPEFAAAEPLFVVPIVPDDSSMVFDFVGTNKDNDEYLSINELESWSITLTLPSLSMTVVKPLNDREGGRSIAQLNPPGNPGSDRIKVLFWVAELSLKI